MHFIDNYLSLFFVVFHLFFTYFAIIFWKFSLWVCRLQHLQDHELTKIARWDSELSILFMFYKKNNTKGQDENPGQTR